MRTLAFKREGVIRSPRRLGVCPKARGGACRGGLEAGFTLVEYLICLLIATFTITTIATGYILASQRTEYATSAAAAQAAVDDQLEIVRGAKWDLHSNPPVTGQVEALAGVQSILLGALRVGATNAIPALLTTEVSMISTNPPLLRVRLECVWSYMDRGPFTNSVVTYRAPDT